MDGIGHPEQSKRDDAAERITLLASTHEESIAPRRQRRTRVVYELSLYAAKRTSYISSTKS